MDTESKACSSCDLKNICDGRLRPLTVSGGVAPNMDLCRHYTCEIGMLYAIRAIRKYMKTHSKIESNIPFGSPHKPVGTRWIRPDLSIVSEQYDKVYPTGQFVPDPSEY